MCWESNRQKRIASDILDHREENAIDNVMIVAGCATDSTKDPLGGITSKRTEAFISK
ncbi:MAG: hypothetical protein PUG10_12390 [Lachnospiraceae bacterium]|nr:hypothetical protein [Lachnospiraceae bacterium]